jgi:hypothetical protein
MAEPAKLILSDFDSYGAAGPAMIVDSVTGIQGSSLSYTKTTALNDRRWLVPKTTLGLPVGLRRGIMSLACKRSVAAPDSCMYGLSVGQSQRDITLSGTCYTLTFMRDSSVAHRLRLTKHTSGGLAIGTQLAFALVPDSADVLTMRLAWDFQDGGAVFEAWLGSALDYSDLVSQFTYVDSPPLASGAGTVGEGFGSTNANMATSGYTTWFDNIDVQGAA